MARPGGREFWSGGTAGVKAPRQHHLGGLWSIREALGRGVNKEVSRKRGKIWAGPDHTGQGQESGSYPQYKRNLAHGRHRDGAPRGE